jgi:hypothetical protein
MDHRQYLKIVQKDGYKNDNEKYLYFSGIAEFILAV